MTGLSGRTGQQNTLLCAAVDANRSPFRNLSGTAVH